MKITDEMIDYISILAKLELSQGERETAKTEIGKIIDYMDTLNAIDTDGIEAMSHAFPVSNVFRKDELKPSVERSQIIENATNKTDECFKVPKTVE